MSSFTQREFLWRCAGWITFVIAAVLYYPRYAKSVVNLAVYLRGAECLWNGQAIIECMPDFTYPPALTLMMLPFVPLSPGLQLVTWYAISIASAVACMGLSEALARRLYPAAAREPNLIWIRIIALVFSLKFILSVLNYQAYDLLVLCLILFGLWALANSRAVTAGGVLAVATALKATPLIFLPYLLIKRRFAAAAMFLIVLALCCVLPDIFNALRGARSDYLQSWIAQVAGPALMPGGTSKQLFWQTWMGPSFDNLSLRGVLNRLVREPLFGLEPRVILAIAYVAVVAVIGTLLLSSSRRNDGFDFTAVDGSILLIGMLALSPISSRYHFVLLMLPYTVLAAASLCDRRIRTLGISTLFVSFMLTIGTSNDLTGAALAEFGHAHGFLLAGALVLLIPLAVIVRIGRPGLEVSLATAAAGSKDKQ